jgi:hypothetical protein
MDIKERIHGYARAQTGIHRLLGWLSIISGIGVGAVAIFAPFKPSERGIAIGFGGFALFLVVAGIMFIRVMAGRTTTAAALLVNRSNLSDPTVVEMRIDGRVFAYQIKFKDPTGQQHVLKLQKRS